MDGGFLLQYNRGTCRLTSLDHQTRRDPSRVLGNGCEVGVTGEAGDGTLYLWSSPFAVCHLYYRIAGDALIVSNDIRLLVGDDSTPLDPAAMFSLFQFGAVSPPLTLFPTIKRVPPGYAVRLTSQAADERYLSYLPPDHPASSPVPTLSAEALIEQALTHEIENIPPESGLFSPEASTRGFSLH
jgi:hypothetical protein